jgi:two-component system, OmpR family, response regulator
VRLLLVEDSPQLGPGLKASLQRHGFAVDLAVDAASAELQMQTARFDVVVLDLGLPGRDGLILLEQWRRRRNNVPVVILTARGEWHERVRGLKAGADDYLTKPFHEEELLARIHAVVRRAIAGTGSPQLCAGGMILDEDSQQVVLADGRRETLTAAEFRVLRCLMLNAGRVVPKERLLEHVYAFDAQVQSNVIEVYVKRLRSKLGQARIRTLRGQGYVFARDEGA